MAKQRGAPYHCRVAAGDILSDQIAYYRARAGEYDEWWFRTGRYDRGEAFNAQWRAEVGEVESAVANWLAVRRPMSLLEFACGTGLFTCQLAPRVGRMTAVDASPEVIAINRARVGSANVEYVQADLFAWRPPARYDAVFFSFWLSHVPDDRFAAFWAGVVAALAPGGFIYLVDSAFDPSSTARDHTLPRPHGQGVGVVTRKLNDGREFRIVKIFHQPAVLTARLARLGLRADLRQTSRYFIHGEVTVPATTAP